MPSLRTKGKKNEAWYATHPNKRSTPKEIAGHHGHKPAGPSILWPALYRHLRAKGYTKEKAARISNAAWNRKHHKGYKNAKSTRVTKSRINALLEKYLSKHGQKGTPGYGLLHGNRIGFSVGEGGGGRSTPPKVPKLKVGQMIRVGSLPPATGPRKAIVLKVGRARINYSVVIIAEGEKKPRFITEVDFWQSQRPPMFVVLSHKPENVKWAKEYAAANAHLLWDA